MLKQDEELLERADAHFFTSKIILRNSFWRFQCRIKAARAAGSVTRIILKLYRNYILKK
jgi:hypothetical protein